MDMSSCFILFSSPNARTQRIDHRISAAVRQPSGRAYAGGRAFGYPRRHQTTKAARTTDFPAAGLAAVTDSQAHRLVHRPVPEQQLHGQIDERPRGVGRPLKRYLS